MPRVIEFDDSLLPVISGEEFNVSCSVKNVIDAPNDITIRWTREGAYQYDTTMDVVSIMTSSEDSDRVVTSTITYNIVVTNQSQSILTENVGLLCIAWTGAADDFTYVGEAVNSNLKLILVECKLLWLFNITS